MKKLIPLLLCFAQLSAANWPAVVDTIAKNPAELELSPIHGGASNINYKLELDGSNYFIRMSPKGQEVYLADACIEYNVLGQIAALGVSPKPLYFDAEKKIMVIDYVPPAEGELDLLDPAVRSQVMNLLRDVEKSGVSIARTFQPYAHVMQLIAQTDKEYAQQFIQEFGPALKQIDAILAKNPKRSLCHLDLHHQNILKTNQRLWLVDWEYAMMSHPYLVLASMASIEHWDDAGMSKLLLDYQGKYTIEDYELLYLYRVAIDLFWTAWNDLQSRISPIDIPYGTWKALYEQSARTRIQSEYFKGIIKSS